MTKRKQLPHRQDGMSLIELMISMMLGLLIVLGISTLFVQNKQSYRQDEMISRMQEDARYALDTLVDDIELAGFWSNMFDPANIALDPSLTIDTDCANVYTLTQSVVVYDRPTNGNAINSVFGCITAANYLANTDAIAIKRVEPMPVQQKAAPNNVLLQDEVYLRTNGAQGMLYQNVAGFVPATAVVGATVEDWRYAPHVYYVRNYANTAGDGIPTLCRFFLDFSGASPTMAEECIAQGVEDLQIEYGIDTSGNGTANRYLANPTNAQLQNGLTAIRVHLLMRSIEADPTNPNTKTYRLSNAADRTPADNFYRRVFTTTVLVRNSRNLNCLNVGCGGGT